MSHRRLSWMKSGVSLWMKHFHAGDVEESQGLVLRDELADCRHDSSTDLPSDEDSGPLERPKITTWEAGWNITNAIQGLFVLGLPFALQQSGYLGLTVMIWAPFMCSYTGKILVSCLYEEDESGRLARVRNTYEDIADACWANIRPGLGGKLVNVAQVLELTMTCVLYLVVGSNLMCHSLFFLPVTPETCSVITFLILTPCVLIRDLRAVSRLSFLCSLAQFLVTFTVIGYCVLQSARWAGPGLRTAAVDFEGFQVAVGVIIFSYTSQIYLPTLEESMMDRQSFSRMMDCTHALACILKTAFSLLTFLTWGEQTKEVITENLPVAVSTVVNVCLLAKALLSYPLPFYAAAEILQNGVLKTDSERWALLLKASLLILTLIMSLYVPHFSLLMGLTGSVTGALMTLVLPALFHVQLKWTQLHMRQKLLDGMILLLGFFCSISGLICSINRILRAFGDE